MANNDKESKNELENFTDCITYKHKNMRRGKPHQPIYRPGSGPLRKSVNDLEENDDRRRHINECNSDYNLHSKKRNDTENVVNDMGHNDSRRRNKKPEQQIYVPKPMAQAMAEREIINMDSSEKTYSKSMTNLSKAPNYDHSDHRNNRRVDQRNGNISHYNGSSERLNSSSSYSKSKRFSANRNRDHLDHGGGGHNQGHNQGHRDRDNTRQASEPRIIGPQNNLNNNRIRDTRSVEPAGNNFMNHNHNHNNYQQSNKIQAKPPSGRRHSTICLEGNKPHKPIPNLETLAPRFRRKYLQENNIDPSAYPGIIEGTTSLPYQPTDNNIHPVPNTYAPPQQQQQQQQQNSIYPGPVPTSYVNMVPHEPSVNPTMPPTPAVWSYTIPNTRVRGRGRLRPENIDQQTQYVNTVIRSLTPDRVVLVSPCNSRPCTPPPFSQKNKSVENIQNAFDHSSNNMYPHQQQRCHTPIQENVRTSDRFTDSSMRNNADKNAPSPVSPSKVSNNTAVREESEEILDWSEEVELNERLEAEALSDSMTRCSSVASLVETVPQNQQQQNNSHRSRRSKRNRGNRNRSTSRNSRRDRSNDNQNRDSDNYDKDNHRQPNHQQQNRRNKHHQSNNDLNHSREHIDRDGFKIPDSRNRRRKNSFRERSNERRRGNERKYDNNNGGNGSGGGGGGGGGGSGSGSGIVNVNVGSGGGGSNSRNSSLDRSRRNSCNEVENWRDEMRQQRATVERKLEQNLPDAIEASVDKPKPGILILPQNPVDRSKPPVLNLPTYRNKPVTAPQRTLYDPNNPTKPIIVTSANARLPSIDTTQLTETEIPNTAVYTTDQFGNVGPAWYDPNYRDLRPQYLMLINDVKRADFELQSIIKCGALINCWNVEVAYFRKFLADSLEFLLLRDIKFCQTENVENHFWKILYYNLIEIMRKAITTDPDNKAQYKIIILSLIDEGTKYFERLLDVLEDGYKFKLDNYLGFNNMPPSKGLGFTGLALVSAQKIFLFLGDLARYKENVNETSNYGKCRQWYIKAQEINPKNGRPYNQLALLAVYARRKLDAVYYYMRSLMSSNPVQSAKESLISLYDENRKKYEQTERKRREEKAKLQMKEKELTHTTKGSLRREIWVHPDGGRRLHRTTSAAQEAMLDSEEEDLYSLPSVEVNRRFITSYLHVHGKLITKIGMETFQQAALQMLREFRVLLQQTPVHLSCNRFLHLLALNMFAIDSTQLKGPELEPGCRSEVQERALVVSLQMFNIILERCVDLLQTHLRQQERADAMAESMEQSGKDSADNSANQHQPIPLCQDLQVILPAVKVWCDWMLCHSSVWNPPPSCADFKVGPASDAWGRLAILMNQLEKLDYQKPVLEYSPSNDSEMVRLPEDATMCGFTPLMYNSQPPVFVRDQVDMESAQMSVRINRLLFFGTEFLCGLEPPVLKLQRYDAFSEYVSVVRTSSRDSPSTLPELCNEELLVESFSEDEDEDKCNNVSVDAPSGEIRNLLDRKVELERRQRTQELHRQRVQAIIDQSTVSVEIEVRPRYLVTDTNCFIDYLDKLQLLATRTHGPHSYTLMVPLVVLGELEGLGRGGKTPAPICRVSLDPEHMLRVADAARRALDFIHCRNPAVKCLTTRGTVLTSSTFTSEDEDRTQDIGPRNDDRILATCLSLCRSNNNSSNNNNNNNNSNNNNCNTGGGSTSGTSGGGGNNINNGSNNNNNNIGTGGNTNQQQQIPQQQQQQQQQSQPLLPSAPPLPLPTQLPSPLDDSEPRKIFREVVLLTDDRNLRVKALARDVPVRELPDFFQWAGLG